MFKRVSHSLLGFFAVAGLVLTTACQQRQEVDEDELGGDTLTVEDTTMMVPPAPPTGMGDTMMGGDTMMMGDTMMDTMMGADTAAM